MTMTMTCNRIIVRAVGGTRFSVAIVFDDGEKEFIGNVEAKEPEDGDYWSDEFENEVRELALDLVYQIVPANVISADATVVVE